jgi:hypothetical protein
MLIVMTVTSLFVIAAIATGLSLVDSWLRARNAYGAISRESQLLAAGFVPQVEAFETRLRQETAYPAHRSARQAVRAYRRRAVETPLFARVTT